jgi:membrane protein insertase Oxa1/YidC/SpoIIIJ
MTLWWGEKIPYISTPDSIGGFFYFGPYLNILPIIAVGLMLWQQNKMMPPPTDEQMAAQQRMMKIMMIVVAVMFYKVAAGLALYFIVSTGWGLIERRFIPKPDDQGGAGTTAGYGPKSGSPNGEVDETPKPKGFIGRMLERARERMEEMKRQADEQSKRQIRKEKGPPGQSPGPGPGPGQQPGRRDDRRDKKKRRRK